MITVSVSAAPNNSATNRQFSMKLDTGECIQKFPDRSPGAELQMVQLSATECSFIAIL
jgi:hypothetical protein